MARHTRLLRLLLGLLVVGLVLGCGLLYVVSLDMAAAYPEWAHIRLPLYVAVVVGTVPAVLAAQVLYGVAALVDRGEAFSESTVRLLRRLELLFGLMAVYLVVGIVAVWAGLHLMHIGILLAWFAAEVVSLFLLTLAAVVQRLFAAALALRQDNELTV